MQKSLEARKLGGYMAEFGKLKIFILLSLPASEPPGLPAFEPPSLPAFQPSVIRVPLAVNLLKIRAGEMIARVAVMAAHFERKRPIVPDIL